MFSGMHPFRQNLVHGVIIVLLSAAYPALPAFAENPETEQHWLISSTRLDGNRTGIQVSHKKMEATPLWLPGTTSVPLSLDDAIASFQRWSREQPGRNARLAVEQLTINEYGCPDHQGHWYYVVYYSFDSGTGETGSGTPRQNSVAVVLMDGSVIGTRTYRE